MIHFFTIFLDKSLKTKYRLKTSDNFIIKSETKNKSKKHFPKTIFSKQIGLNLLQRDVYKLTANLFINLHFRAVKRNNWVL